MNNLVKIDYNKIQSLDFVNKTLKLQPLKKKFTSFGCKVLEIDGHNHKEIFKSLKNSSNFVIIKYYKRKRNKFYGNIKVLGIINHQMIMN